MKLTNYIDGVWQEEAASYAAVLNPANGEELAQVPLSTEVEVGQAVASAKRRRSSGLWCRRLSVRIISMKLVV